MLNARLGTVSVAMDRRPVSDEDITTMSIGNNT